MFRGPPSGGAGEPLLFVCFLERKMIMNVLILTVAFFVCFVAGIFLGREMTYWADGMTYRKRRKERKYNVPPVAGGYIDDAAKHWPRGQ